MSPAERKAAIKRGADTERKIIKTAKAMLADNTEAAK